MRRGTDDVIESRDQAIREARRDRDASYEEAEVDGAEQEIDLELQIADRVGRQRSYQHLAEHGAPVALDVRRGAFRDAGVRF